jgi:hypothetical protein
VPRRMKPGEALAAYYPAVAATWHPDRNGTWTPENTSAKNSYPAMVAPRGFEPPTHGLGMCSVGDRRSLVIDGYAA